MLEAVVQNLVVRRPGARDTCQPGIKIARSDVSEKILPPPPG